MQARFRTSHLHRLTQMIGVRQKNRTTSGANFIVLNERNDRKGFGPATTSEIETLEIAMESGQNARNVWALAERFCQNGPGFADFFRCRRAKFA